MSVPLLSPDGDAALAALAAARTLYAFDFDGTLAPIVPRPGDAKAPGHVVRLIDRLAERVPVAILTGRGVDDLRARFAARIGHLVGNHGAEGMPDGPHDAADAAPVVDGWVAQWSTALGAHATAGAVEGIVVERKSHSLSIHDRLAPDPVAAARLVRAAIARLVPPPRVVDGKHVFNLLPPGAPDKGDALARLVAHERCEAAFFIGDDETDECAFRKAAAHWVTVRVGPMERTAARFHVDDQSAVERVVERLLERVSAR